jgi:hypothetical protein
LIVVVVVLAVTMLAMLAGLLPLVLPVLLIAGIVWLATRRRPEPPPRLPAPTAGA